MPADVEELDEDTQALLAADFEIGEVMRQRLVQRAVLFFTGEALDDDDYDDDDEEEDEEDEDEMDDEEDSENDEDFDPAAAAKQAGKKGGKGKGKQNPEECKQQ